VSMPLHFAARDSISSSYYRKILFALSSDPFYNTFVRLPGRHAPIPQQIRQNPKWFPYFSSILGAMDGTHIRCCPSTLDRHLMRDRKGQFTQNVLAVCGFDLCFHYILSGWDGCATDSLVYADARTSDLRIPSGRRYLADAGFGICDALLVPYRGVRYHLAEWGRADQRCLTS
jgi:hypothetical protein